MAYLLGIIDTSTGQFRGCDILSEEWPTLPGRLWPFVIAKVTRLGSYAEDSAELRRIIDESPALQWTKRFLVERDASRMPPDCVDLLREGAAHVCDHFDEVPVPRDLLGWADRAQEAVRRLRGGA